MPHTTESFGDNGLHRLTPSNDLKTGGAYLETNFAAINSALDTKADLPITSEQVSGLAPIATSGSASDLSSGTVPSARLALTASDIPSLAESKITNLTTDLAAKANLAGAAFTGDVSVATSLHATNVGLYDPANDDYFAISADDSTLTIPGDIGIQGLSSFMTAQGGTAGQFQVDSSGNVIGHSFSGIGSGLTSLTAANVTGSHTLPDGVLSTNIPLLNTANTFTGRNTFNSGTITTSQSLAISQTWNASAQTFTAFQIAITDNASQSLSNVISAVVAGSTIFSVGKGGAVTANSFSGSGSGLTSLTAANIAGSHTLADGVLSTNVPLLNVANTFSTGQTITGTCTATTFSGSGASLTTIPELAVTNLTTDLAAKVPTTRTISTTTPITGGGDLSANRTIAITKADATHDGYLASTDFNTFNSKGTNYSGYGTGTEYTLGSMDAVVFGTTSPTITITVAGTYLIMSSVVATSNGPGDPYELSLKLRRTNNTAADIANSSLTFEYQVDTNTAVPLPTVIYTASAGDIVSIFASSDNGEGEAIVAASIVAVKIA